MILSLSLSKGVSSPYANCASKLCSIPCTFLIDFSFICVLFYTMYSSFFLSRSINAATILR